MVAPHSPRFIAIIAAVLVLGCSSDPNNGTVLCASAPPYCADGFECKAGACWRTGTGPADAGTLGTDGGGATLAEAGSELAGEVATWVDAGLSGDAPRGLDSSEDRSIVDQATLDGPVVDSPSYDAADAPLSGTGGLDGSRGTGGSGGSADVALDTSGAGGALGTGGLSATGGVAGRGGVGAGGIVGSGGVVGTGGAGTGGAGTGGAGTGGAGTGGAGTGGASPTWCESRTPSSTTDYQCVDFDKGLPPSSTWPIATSNGGTLVRTNASSSSSPSSILATVPAVAADGTPGSAVISWHATGSTAVNFVSLAADLNPGTPDTTTPWAGTIKIMCLQFTYGYSCLMYTQGGDTQFATGYTGYFIQVGHWGTSSRTVECSANRSPAANAWTHVEIQVDSNTGDTIMLSGGIPAAVCTGGLGLSDGDTSYTAAVGMTEEVPVAVPWTMSYDNVVVYATRN